MSLIKLLDESETKVKQQCKIAVEIMINRKVAGDASGKGS
jgi:hypothetical protein